MTSQSHDASCPLNPSLALNAAAESAVHVLTINADALHGIAELLPVDHDETRRAASLIRLVAADMERAATSLDSALIGQSEFEIALSGPMAKALEDYAAAHGLSAAEAASKFVTAAVGGGDE